MFEGMVTGAEAGQVVDRGRAAEGMVAVVVDLTAGGRSVAAGESAALVAWRRWRFIASVGV